MRILIFSLTYFPYIGGAEVAVRELTDRMSDFEFHMITLRVDKKLPAKEKIGNIIVHRIGFTGTVDGHSHISFPLSINKYLFPFLAFFEALSLHRTEKFDAIWSIMANYAGFGAFFFKWLRPDIPFFLNIQEGDSIAHIKKRVGIATPLFKEIFKRADYVHAISNFLSSFAVSLGSKNVEVVPNGVEAASYLKGYSTFEIESLKKQYGIPAESVILITTSRLVVKNGVKDIIASLEFLPDIVHLIIVGDGPQKEKLAALTEEKRFASRVHFAGKIAYEDIPKYLKTARVFVRPSLSEGLGNSFLEAMAAGIPVVGTSVGGIPDFLFDPKDSSEPTGLFCEPNNPESIAVAVEKILSNKELADTLISNARTLVCEKYDWKKISRTLSTSFLKTISYEKN
ncbi:MAG: glycosyltransferase family 4 protein [Candidatus Pacebacteria bacterium]|nr:glycosyltransferase family 4 protein [Candidatus Paceibacterota bacterium]